MMFKQTKGHFELCGDPYDWLEKKKEEKGRGGTTNYTTNLNEYSIYLFMQTAS
jgi:hypothetical protein